MTNLEDEVLINVEQAGFEAPNGEEIEVSPFMRLIENIQSKNIAESLSEQELTEIAEDVIDRFEEDQQSMADWSELVEEGMDLVKPDFTAKNEPFQGAANYRSQVITDAVNKFGDRCSTEILNKKAICKADIHGQDPTGSKAKRGERVAQMINYELRYGIKDWIDSQDKLFYQIALQGTIFKKTYFDPVADENVSEVISYPNFAVNQATTDLNSACFSSVAQYSAREVMTKQLAGTWLEIKPILKDLEDAQEQTNQPIDNDNSFIEQLCFIDLDGDDYPEPYIVTVHYNSRQVVRIIARYNESTISVKSQGQIVKVSEMRQPDLNPEIVEIQPTDQITKYGFIRDPNGGYLDLGYSHLLAAYCGGINKITNTLMNAGELATLQGGYLAKGVRKKMGIDRFKAGQYVQTNIEARDLAGSILPLNFKEPSPTLLNLRDQLKVEAQNSSASAEFTEFMGQNTPAATTLSMMQEQLMSTSSIIARIYRAMSREFMIIHGLLRDFGDGQKYLTLIDDPELLQAINQGAIDADSAMALDFMYDDLDVIPTANPELSSRMQRIMQANAEVEQFDRILQMQGNGQEVLRNYFKTIGVESSQIDKYFPQPAPQAIEQQNQLLQEQNQLQMQQNEINSRIVATEEQKNQIQLLKLQNEAKDKGTRQQIDLIKAQSEAEKRIAEIERMRAETVLKYEQAETEQLKNQVDIYSKKLDQANAELEIINKLMGGNSEA